MMHKLNVRKTEQISLLHSQNIKLTNKRTNWIKTD